MTGAPKSQPTTATPGPWTISEVRSVEGEYLIVGGEGQEFGLIASCPVKADAEAIVAAQARIEELEGHLRTAIRQWEMYADVCERPDDDGFNLSDEKSPEADLFRAARAALNPKGAE